MLSTATFSLLHPGDSSARVLSHCLSIFLARLPQPGSLPVCGDGAFGMWFLRKCLSMVGVGASQRPKAAGGLCCQLRVHRASPPWRRPHTAAGGGTPSHHCPALARRHRPLHLADAGAELVSSLPVNESSQLSPGSFPGLVFCHLNEWQRRSPGSTRGDASESSSPGSRGDPPTSSRDPWAWLSCLRTAAWMCRDEQSGCTDDGEQAEAPAGGEGRAGSLTRQNLELLPSAAVCTQEAVTSGLLLKLVFLSERKLFDCCGKTRAYLGLCSAKHLAEGCGSDHARTGVVVSGRNKHKDT